MNKELDADAAALSKAPPSVRLWRTISIDLVADCRVFSVHRHLSSRDSHAASKDSTGEKEDDTHSFFIVRPSNWVNVIPITDDGKVIMIEQFRHGIADITLEIPGGMVDLEDGGSAIAAERELLEETGYKGRELHYLGTNHPNPAMQPNICDTYLSVGVSHIQMPNFDTTEEIAIRLVPLNEVPELISSGKISHALVIVAFQYLQLFALKNPQYRHLNPFSCDTCD